MAHCSSPTPTQGFVTSALIPTIWVKVPGSGRLFYPLGQLLASDIAQAHLKRDVDEPIKTA